MRLQVPFPSGFRVSTAVALDLAACCSYSVVRYNCRAFPLFGWPGITYYSSHVLYGKFRQAFSTHSASRFVLFHHVAASSHSRLTSSFTTYPPNNTLMQALQPKTSQSSRIYNPRRNAQQPAETTQGKKPVGRNVGKFLQIMNMPIDVFLEVHVFALATKCPLLTSDSDRHASAPSRPLAPFTRLQ